MLVRQRGALFEAIIRALKNAGIAGRRRRPAGADRAHRGDGPDGARRRAAAAGRTIWRWRRVLKSPLFGLDEDELFALAWDRKGSAARGAARRERARLSRAARSTRYARMARGS